MKVKASNSILKSRLDRLMRELEIKYTGKMLTNGSCRLCKTCNKKNNLPCKKPFEMRYSMEALGLNVAQIAQHFFGHRLLWYKDKKAPSYSSVVSCLLTNEFPTEEEIIFELKKLALTWQVMWLVTPSQKLWSIGVSISYISSIEIASSNLPCLAGLYWWARKTTQSTLRVWLLSKFARVKRKAPWENT